MDQHNMLEQETRNEKRYLIDFDQIMLDYNWEKNASFDPARITKGSNKKIEWKCHVCGHEWVATPYTRITANHGCHMCAVRNRSQRTVKDSAESIGNLVPESLTYWDYENNHFTPFEVSSMSSKIIHWKCQNGHSWVAKASKFSIGQRCPYCIGKKVLTGYNDLATKRPDLMGEWDYERNIAIDPRTTYYLSQQYAWWTCVNSHSWKAKISARQTTGCPYCSNKKVSKENNLEQNYPQLASEWNYEKNYPLLPSQVIMHSGKKVWWKCQYGHEWQATIHKRTSSHQSCPTCAMKYSTSFPEQTLVFYLSKAFHIENRAIVCNFEADLLIDELKLIIEYNGIRFHSSEEKRAFDLKKRQAFLQAGYHVLIIEEVQENCCIDLVDNTIQYLPKYDYKNLDVVLALICSYIRNFFNRDINIDIDLSRDRHQIVEEYTQKSINNSFGAKYPQKIKYWNIEQNGNLTPFMFSAGARMVVIWTCDKCGHTWPKAIKLFAKGKRCPKCRSSFD